MPWNEVSTVRLRREFVALANQQGANHSELCRRFGISRKTGYKWLDRWQEGQRQSLEDRSTRPFHSPFKTPEEVEKQVITLRMQHPDWGGRKLRRRLQDLGSQKVPSASTITEILRRHDLLGSEHTQHQTKWQRFEHPQPNDLWQMDFKGPVVVGHHEGHLLTVLDDHSRYSLGVEVCQSQTYVPTFNALRTIFRRYGLPRRMTMDNGNPWGNSHGRWTQMSAWFIDQGIRISFSRPYHPQTQGKDERFHRTLKAELLNRVDFEDDRHCQQACNRWREIYNYHRPHDSLGLATPITRYRPSPRAYRDAVREYEYSPDDTVRKVNQTGQIRYQGNSYKISEAFRGRNVGLRPTEQDGKIAVYYRHQKVATLDLTVNNV